MSSYSRIVGRTYNLGSVFEKENWKRCQLLRILHAPAEIAGQVAMSAYGQREIGHVAHAFFSPHPLGYSLQPDIFLKTRSPWLTRVETALLLGWFVLKYDVFHFHGGRSFVSDSAQNSDVRFLRRMGCKVAVEFWGSDIRMNSVEAERNPYFTRDEPDDSHTKQDRMKRWAELTGGHAIISDCFFHPYLAKYFRYIHVVGHRVDTQRLKPIYPNPQTQIPVVVHAPSNKAIKGTPYVRKAVERLQAKGKRFIYKEVHGLSQPEALKIYAQADLVIDQLRIGAHGVFAVEAMSMGKPVICYILPELVSTYEDGFPIINANPDTIEEVMEEWLDRPEDRYLRGVQSRLYSERVHDCRAVAKKLIETYKALPQL